MAEMVDRSLAASHCSAGRAETEANVRDQARMALSCILRFTEGRSVVFFLT